jgi:tRNA threonylcarbamoyladenosine biosynthesis protein TsaE
VITIDCATAEATRAVGARLGEGAGPGDVFALVGELGTGKTCLVQGLAAGLGVRERVTSPTFVLVAEHAGRLRLFHVDLYRTSTLAEAEALGLEDLMDGDGVTAIEWAEKAEALLPGRTVWIRIEGVGFGSRRLGIEGLPPGRPDPRG